MSDSPAAARPLLLRVTPPALRTRLYTRLWGERRAAEYPALFARAPLDFAPGVSMVGLRPGDIISGHIAMTGQYEAKLSRLLRDLGRQGGLLVDVGANMGYFSLLWASARQGNRVTAFEASPDIAALLRGNVAANGMDNAITVVSKAASDAAGTVRFSIGPDDQTGWGGIQPDDPQAIEVEAVRLDEELAGQDIAVLKIDVEGAESMVLRGAEKLLRDKRIGRLFFESNAEREGKLGFAFSDVLAFVEGCGYRATAIDRQRTEWSAVPA